MSVKNKINTSKYISLSKEELAKAINTNKKNLRYAKTDKDKQHFTTLVANMEKYYKVYDVLNKV